MPHCGISSSVKGSVGPDIDSAELTAKQAKEFLKLNPFLLEEFLIEYFDEEFLVRVIGRKRRMSMEYGSNRERHCMINSDHLVTGITEDQLYKHVYDISYKLAKWVRAEVCSMYLICNDGFMLYGLDQNVKLVEHIPAVPAFVAIAKIAINVSAVRLKHDPRFKKSVDPKTGGLKLHHSIAVPILTASKFVSAIIQLERPKEHDGFSEREFDFITSILSWITVCIQSIKLTKCRTQQSIFNENVSQKVLPLFQNTVKSDVFLLNIVTVTKELIPCEHCTLHVIDDAIDRVFTDFESWKTNSDDLKVHLRTEFQHHPLETNQDTIGHVFHTGQVDSKMVVAILALLLLIFVLIMYMYSYGQVVKIKGVQEHQEQSSNDTRHTMLVPIGFRPGILAVIEVTNSDSFTTTDEETLKTLAVFFARAFQHHRIYNRLVQSREKFQAAVESLQTTSVSINAEAEMLRKQSFLEEKETPPDFDQFHFCCYSYDPLLPRLLIRIIQDTFAQTVDIAKLCRFVLTVRPKYQAVPYHNWHHAFHTTHCLWQMIKRCKMDAFTEVEKMSLIIGALCHDIEHQRCRDHHFIDLDPPLAALYSSYSIDDSYKQTIIILHMEGNEICSFLTADEHRTLLNLIKRNMVATDLTGYFSKYNSLSSLVESNDFCMDVKVHRTALMHAMMVGAGLCVVCKPWDTSLLTARLALDEYCGEIEFIKHICQPLYKLLKTVLPQTKPLLEGCLANKTSWEVLAERHAVSCKEIAPVVEDISANADDRDHSICMRDKNVEGDGLLNEETITDARV